MKIATYSICKNEAKHVERWLAATSESDVRVVADTGSTDNSVELLEAAGVAVYRITVAPWRFDVARNTALSLVPADADVCLSLDLDEVPEYGFYQKVKDSWESSTHKAYVQMNTGSTWWADRLHSRHGWRWVSPCHEVTEWYGDGIPRLARIPASIDHLPDDNKSRGQYLGLLEMAVRENRTDPRAWVYLCREYVFYHIWDKCIDAANHALANGAWAPEEAAVCRWAGDAQRALGNDTFATAWYQRGIKLHESQESLYALAFDAYLNKDWDACADACRRGMRLPSTDNYLHDASLAAWRFDDLLSIAYWHLGERALAAVHARIALQANGPDSDRISANLEMMENHEFAS